MATEEDIHHLEKQNTDHDEGEVSAEKTQQERAWSICQVHGKDLMPLLCQDCESAVCLDCLVKTHVGHKMSNISECVEEKVEKLNDAILRKESSCFDLKELQGNLQERQRYIEDQKNMLIQQVRDREEEIVTEVKSVCQQTIDRISELANERECPMMKDEEILKTLIDSDLFRNETVEDCIKSLHFYNKLQTLNIKYSAKKHDDVPFTFVSRDFSSEKITELVGSVLTDPDLELSSDEHVENKEDVTNKEVNYKSEKDDKPKLFQEKALDKKVDAITLLSSERSLLYSNSILYQQNNSKAEKIVGSVKHFSHIPESDEIVFTVLWSRNTIWRQSASGQSKSQFKLMEMICDEVCAISHDGTCYLRVLYFVQYKNINDKIMKRYKVSFVDDMGCKKKEKSLGDRSGESSGRFKFDTFGIVELTNNQILVKKGLDINLDLFSYSGSVGNDPKSRFRPTDLCRDNEGSFLIVDSHDSTVHLLDSTGKFLRIIMSLEDGIGKIQCIAMDSLGWLRLGCDDGSVLHANYRYFKDTPRIKRILEKQNQ